MSKFANLQPASVWNFFEHITTLPRPSKHEEKVREYLIDFAQSKGLEHKVDKTGNILIIKNASKGMESAPGVVLQSHLDMVCEKNSDVQFDFMKDAIKVKIEDGWVKAQGTTLGADDGIGMAAALAVLDATDLVHGPLEALFTVDEETGLTGAFGLGKDMLTGKYLINLDSEDDGEVFIGCAGGVDTVVTFKPHYEHLQESYSLFKITVSGLKGGHSGDNINDGLANSNKLLARFLWRAAQSFDIRLCSISGGNLRNAIPRESEAVVAVRGSREEALGELFSEVAAECKNEYNLTEPQMNFTMEQQDKGSVSSLMDKTTHTNLINAIQGVPNGVFAMSRSMQGLVETSSNLASVKSNSDGNIIVVSSQRSSVESAKWDAAHSIEAVFLLADAQVSHSEGYPGWAPNLDSKLLTLTVAAHKELFDVEPKVRAIHAGLECGLFLEKYPHLEMVSFGPTLRGVHSPDERLEIATVDRFWKLLTTLLSKIKD